MSNGEAGAWLRPYRIKPQREQVLVICWWCWVGASSQHPPGWKIKHRSCGGAGLGTAQSDDLHGPCGPLGSLISGQGGDGDSDGITTLGGDPPQSSSSAPLWDYCAFPHSQRGIGMQRGFPAPSDAQSWKISPAPLCMSSLRNHVLLTPLCRVYGDDISLPSMPKAGWTPGLSL